jgi:hypothetical protein
MDIAGLTIRCNGINHKDTGKITKCKGCGTHLARRDDGKLFGVRRYTTEYGNERFAYSCYAPTHKCDPERAKRYHEAAQRDIDAGEMVRGQSVIVARGRKIPKGITGTIHLGWRERLGATRPRPTPIRGRVLHPHKEPRCDQARLAVDPTTSAAV